MKMKPVQSIDALITWFVEAGITCFDLAVQRRDRAGHAIDFLAPRVFPDSAIVNPIGMG